jgi:putative nucleotidyltransferase with HDIG domain
MFVHGIDGGWLDHPFWRTQFLIGDEAKLREVRASGVPHCWIDVSKGRDLSAERLSGPLIAAGPDSKESSPAQAKPALLSDELQHAARLRSRSAETMRRLHSEVRLGNIIEGEECASLVDDVIESINRHPDALVSLLRLKTADQYTYLHSVAVCALMVALGRQLGMNQAQCRDAGLAGMLHDLGKALMPQEILNKPGKLTPEEFAVIKSHPVRGYEILRASGKFSDAVLDVCRHHHERFDGAGYPDGLSGQQIPLMARMGAVCDVYDAVTSDRPYKAGWDPAHALSQMVSWKGHFDTAVFQTFVKSVGIYPTGSLVRMRSGRLAVVLDQNPSALTKPRVKLFFSTKAGMPLVPQVMDLASAAATDQIEAREPQEKWHFSYLNELWGGDAVLA